MSSKTNLVNVREREGARTAILFVHGFSGDESGTWGEFPRFLVDEPTLDGWDIHNVGYSTSLAPDILRSVTTSSREHDDDPPTSDCHDPSHPPAQ